MEIVWLGQSAFRLRSDQVVTLTDPFPETVGLGMGRVEPQLVTVSHQHPNHSYLAGVQGRPRVVAGPGEYELSGVYVRGVLTPRGEGDPPAKRNTAYLMEMESLRVSHLGDISGLLATRQVEALTPVDILLVPAGGVCTLDVSQVVQTVRLLEPRVVIPMHYRLPGLPGELGTLESFLREMGLREVQPLARLNVSTSSLPQETRVVVLEAQGVRSG